MSLKMMVNQKDIWDAFQEELDERISSVHIQMEQATQVEHFWRYQGEVFALRRLKQLREKVNG